MLFDNADSDTNDAVTVRVPDQKIRRGRDTPCYIWGKDTVSADVWHPSCLPMSIPSRSATAVTAVQVN